VFLATAPSHRGSKGEEVALAGRWDAGFPPSPHGGDAPLICVGWGRGNPCQACDGELDSGKVMGGAEGRRRRQWWEGPGDVGAWSVCQCPLSSGPGCSAVCTSLPWRRLLPSAKSEKILDFPSLTLQNLGPASRIQ